MQVQRKLTVCGQSPYAGIAFKSVAIEVCHVDAQHRICIPKFEVPAHWSYAASEFLARHYVRRHGVPAAVEAVAEEGVPQWLWRCVAAQGADCQGGEISAKQIFHRLAGAWSYWGWTHGYFDTPDDVRAFYDECCAMLAMQMAAPASPQWLNTGLHWAYGLEGEPQGHYFVDAETGSIAASSYAYVRPQHHHCFIQSVKDELVSDGGIMDLWEREARVFQYGSGAGCNMSSIRSSHEAAARSESSVGLMRFLAIGDKAAAAVKAGGSALKVDKLVLVDMDHPDIEAFIQWKAEEEHKAAAMVTGARQMRKHLGRIFEATQHGEGDARFSHMQNDCLKHAIRQAQRAMIPNSYITRVVDYARQGFSEIIMPVYGTDADSAIYLSVGAHQARLAVRVSDAFLQAVERREGWALRARVDDAALSTVRATELMDNLAQAAWATGDPSVQFADTIEAWNPCTADGPIRGSSPKAEFLFLDDTACDMASLNLLRFVREDGHFDVAGFEHAARLMTIMLDISITMAQFPSRSIACNTYRYRPIGLSYCNLAALVMQMGYAYDSDEARSIAAAISAVMTGVGYCTSADMAKELGAFDAFTANRTRMMQVVRQHQEAAYGRSQHLGSVDVMPVVLDVASLPDSELEEAVRRLWDMAVLRGEQYGFSNAQVSAVGTTPNMARLMDADTAGVAPEISLIKYALQPHGGVRKYVPQHVLLALKALGYSDAQRRDIATYMCGRASLLHAPAIDHDALRAKGLGSDELQKLEEALGHCAHVRMAFDPFVLGERFCRDVLQLDDAQCYHAGFDLLAHLGFSADEIAQANAYACGAGSLEDAPHLDEGDLAVFRLSAQMPAEAQLLMMAAVQPFVSGGVSHRICVAQHSSIDACRQWMMQAWKLGLKSLALHRVGSGLHHTAIELEDEAEDQEPLAMLQPTVLAMQMVRDVTQARRELPLRRGGFTQKAVIGGQTVYLRTGDYPDGRLGEIFIDMPKQTATMRHMVNQFAIAISIALQYGVPLEAFVDAFRLSQFGPSGMVEGSGVVDSATSVLDYIFRELSASYLQPDGEDAPVHDRVSAQVLAWEKQAATDLA